MHVWDAATGAYIPHKYGAALNSTPTGFRDWVVAHADIAAYFPMDGLINQKDEVTSTEYPPSAPGLGVQDARLDTMFWGDDSGSFNFGVEKTPTVLTAVGVGVGSVTGTYRFICFYESNTAPYPWYNVAYSPWITVSGVDHIDIAFADDPGAITGQWIGQYNHADQHRQLASTSSHGFTVSAVDLDPSSYTSTYASLSASNQYRPIRESLGYYEIGAVHSFGGTDPFTVLVDIRHQLSDLNNLSPDWNWIASSFNDDQTEGWGLGMALASYDNLVIRAVRRNASGEDHVDITSGSPQTYNRHEQYGVSLTYDGTTMRLAIDHQFSSPTPTTVASSRSIDDTDAVFRIGDGYVGQVDDLIIFDAKLSDAEIIAVAAHRDDVYQAETDGEIYNGDPDETYPEDPNPAVFDTSRSVLKFTPGTWPRYSTDWEGFLDEFLVGIALRIDPDDDNAIICEWFYDVDDGIGMRCYPRVAGVPESTFQNGVSSQNGGLFPHAGFEQAIYEESGILLEEDAFYWVTADVRTTGDEHLVTMGFWLEQPVDNAFMGTPALEASVNITGSGYKPLFTAPKKTGLSPYRPMSPHGRLLSFRTKEIDT